MKIFNKYFKSINLVGLMVVTFFAIMGVSYCNWNDMSNLNYNLKTGQLKLENNNEKSLYNIDLNNCLDEFFIPFNINNYSTMPVKKKSVSCYMYNEDISKMCKIEFSESDSDEIKGKIILDLNKIDNLMMQKEFVDYSLIIEPIKISEMLEIKLEFMQDNIDKDGWKDLIHFDICINKTIMPIIPTETIIPEAVPILSNISNLPVSSVNENNTTEDLISDDIQTDEQQIEETSIIEAESNEHDAEEVENAEEPIKSSEVENSGESLKSNEAEVDDVQTEETSIKEAESNEHNVEEVENAEEPIESSEEDTEESLKSKELEVENIETDNVLIEETQITDFESDKSRQEE